MVLLKYERSRRKTPSPYLLFPSNAIFELCPYPYYNYIKSIGVIKADCFIVCLFLRALVLDHLKITLYGIGGFTSNSEAITGYIVRWRRINWMMVAYVEWCLFLQIVANKCLEQILSISVYVESKISPKTPLGERATMYPGPAPRQRSS